jgi:UrcA family protein
MKILIAAALAAALATPAAARTVEHGPKETTTIAVSSAGLDLTRKSGAQHMLNRLDRAALSACGASEFSVRDYQQAVRRTACYREAMDRAVASVDAPAVGALYQQKDAPQIAAR